MFGMSGWELVENVCVQNIKVLIVMILVDVSEGQLIVEWDSDDYVVLYDVYLIKLIWVINLLE